MRTTNNAASLPEAKVCHFELKESGWYQMTDCPPGFTKVPPELRIEETFRADIAGIARAVIHSRKQGGKYLFFTGIIPAGRPGLYFGDFYEFKGGKKLNSFCLFNLSGDSRRLEVHFFSNFKVYPNQRARLISRYWQQK